MSVIVGYMGRFGNRMFEYAAARLFAEKTGLELESPLDQKDDFIATTPCLKGRSIKTGRITIDDSNLDLLSRPYPPAEYFFRGYFQRWEWFEANRQQVLGFFETDDQPKNSEDIVIHLRLEDYKIHQVVIDPEWYLDILKTESFKRLHIVGNFDPSNDFDKSYLARFEKYDPIISQSDIKTDFYKLMGFEKIVCSNSTYCFWALFLGEPSKAYIFKPWVRCSTISMYPIQNAVEIDGRFAAVI